MSEGTTSGATSSGSTSSTQSQSSNQSTVTPTGQGASNAKAQGNTSQGAQGGAQKSSQGYNNQTGQSHESAKSQSTETAQASKESEQDFEEITVGQTKAKVTKEIAALVKNLEKGFQSKAQEAAQFRKMVEGAKQNPREFFKATGMDPAAFAEEVLAEKYEYMNLSDEQKQLKSAQEELNKYKSVESQSKKQLVDQLKSLGDQIPDNIEDYSKEEIAEYVQHRTQAFHQESQNLDHEIGQAFTDSGLPADKYTIAKVAFEMSSAARQNKNLSAKDALAKVTKGYYDGTREHFSKMDGKRIHELLGEDVLGKIRKYDLERVNENAAFKIGPQNGQGSNSSSQDQSQKKALNQIEWRKAMGLE
ncbi:MAG: hypothetical protein H0X02_07465 [Nitrosomonas sp.]|nr:hypothetical protein [Nitrosomonas sp.]